MGWLGPAEGFTPVRNILLRRILDRTHVPMAATKVPATSSLKIIPITKLSSPATTVSPTRRGNIKRISCFIFFLCFKCVIHLFFITQKAFALVDAYRRKILHLDKKIVKGVSCEGVCREVIS